MPDTLHTPHPIWQTPMRDLARGRVTGRLDWPGRLAQADLPDDVKTVITRTVKRTKLWRLEKAGVAAELISHFTDGLAVGGDAETLIKNFGDERTAAKLIRRAKKRNRPLPWHVWRNALRGGSVLLALYAIVLARFFILRPTVKVDYVAQLNADVEKTPLDQRAWPLLRRAIIEMKLTRNSEPIGHAIARANDTGRDLDLADAKPSDPEWPDLIVWLDAHRGSVDLIRQAAAEPGFGFVFGRAGSLDDSELWGPHTPAAVKYNTEHPADKQKLSSSGDTLLSQVLLAALNSKYSLKRVLSADARVARTIPDADRVTNDLTALLQFGAVHDSPFPVSHMVDLGIEEAAFDSIAEVLTQSPDLLSDRQWIALAHRVAGIGGDAPGSLFDLKAERLLFLDLIQRCYSDDGNGDGVLTAHGAALLPFYSSSLANSADTTDERGFALQLTVTGVTSLLSSRKDVLAEYDCLAAINALRLSRPLRDVPEGGDPFEQVHARLAEIRSSKSLSIRYLPVALMGPEIYRAAQFAEHTLGRRDGTCVGIALELYRRRNGGYPASLDALVPTYLPAVPVDRIAGGPVRYKIKNGKPAVYSVGIDGVDDGGVPQKDAMGRPVDASYWWPRRTDVHGDWILFGG